MVGKGAVLHKAVGMVVIGLMVGTGVLGAPTSALAASETVDVGSSRVAASQEMLSGAAGLPSIPGTRVSMGDYSIVLPEEMQATQKIKDDTITWSREGLTILFGENVLTVEKPSRFDSIDFQAEVERLAKDMGGSEVFPLDVPANLRGCSVYGFRMSDDVCIVVFLPRNDGVCDMVAMIASVDEWVAYVDSIAASIAPVDVELLGELEMVPSDLLSADLSLLGKVPDMTDSERSATQSLLAGQSGRDSVLYSLDVKSGVGGSTVWMAGVISTNDTGRWTRGQIEGLLSLCGIDDPDFNDWREVYTFPSYDDEEAANEIVSGSYNPGSGRRAVWEFIAVSGLPIVFVAITFI